LQIPHETEATAPSPPSALLFVSPLSFHVVPYGQTPSQRPAERPVLDAFSQEIPLGSGSGIAGPILHALKTRSPQRLLNFPGLLQLACCSDLLDIGAVVAAILQAK
jgi:hypothetical protein